MGVQLAYRPYHTFVYVALWRPSEKRSTSVGKTKRCSWLMYTTTAHDKLSSVADPASSVATWCIDAGEFDTYIVVGRLQIGDHDLRNNQHAGVSFAHWRCKCTLTR